MPDGSGRIRPVAFTLTDAEWQRIFGKRVDGPSARVDVPAKDCGSGVQDPQPPEDEEVRGVR